MRDWQPFLDSLKRFLEKPTEGRWRGVVKEAHASYICQVFRQQQCQSCMFQCDVVFEPGFRLTRDGLMMGSCTFYPTSWAYNIGTIARVRKMTHKQVLLKLHMYYLETFDIIEEGIRKLREELDEEERR